MGTELFLGFGLDAWITILTVFGMFTVLLFTKLRSDLVFLGAIAVLYVTGVLTDKEAFSGISAPSVIAIGVLFVVVAGLMHTGQIEELLELKNSHGLVSADHHVFQYSEIGSHHQLRTAYVTFQALPSVLPWEYSMCAAPTPS